MSKRHVDPFFLCFVIIAILGVLYSLVSSESYAELKDSNHPTTYSQSRFGAQGLFLVLEKLGKDTYRWKRPYPLLEHEEVGTLVVINPSKPFSPREGDALEQWCSRGGRMVFLKSDDWEIKSSGYEEEGSSFLDRFEDNPLLVVISEPSKVMNQSLKEEPGESVALIQNLIAYPGPVYFDEYHLNHGEGSGTWGLLKKFFQQPIGWVALQIIIALFVYLMCTPNNKYHRHKKIKKQANLINERAAFLKVSKARVFAETIVSKYRSNTSG